MKKKLSGGDSSGPTVQERLGAIEKAILDFLASIPETDEPQAAEPIDRVRSIARIAAMKAAATSATLALPPGPLGILTILPDIAAIWRIQAQMVADIAAAFGKTAYLTREQMLYCLFRHAAAHAVRDLVVRAGERVLIRRATLGMLQSAARKIGVRFTQRLLGRSISRWVPVVGALGVGGYAYYDTGQVAATAMELFQQKLEIESEAPATSRKAGSRARSRRGKARRRPTARSGNPRQKQPGRKRGK